MSPTFPSARRTSQPFPDKVMATKAIGVFDSGVGGLTVLKAIHQRLPTERTAYLGDTARVPYGPRSPEVVIRYCMDNARFLLGQDLKLLVVACNTASAVALSALREVLPIPVLGVIDSGAKAACEATKSGRIGIIGTKGTVKSGAYERAIQAFRRDVQMKAVSCPLFVSLAEEGWTDGEIARLVAQKYLSQFGDFHMDTLVLGCTHYPLLKDVMGQVLGTAVTLVEPAQTTAQAVEALLNTLGWMAPKTLERPRHTFFVTDQPEQFEDVGHRFLGEPLTGIQRVKLPDDGIRPEDWRI